MKFKYLYFIVFLLSLSIELSSQNNRNYFLELGGNKDWLMKKKWDFNLSGSFKMQIHDNSKWRQTFVDAAFTKTANEYWAVFTGISNFYTNQQNNNNFYEIRPYAGVNLKTPILPQFQLQQRAKWEVRNYFFKDKVNNNTSNRFRYKISLDYKLNKKRPENPYYWSINSGFEWYFIREPNSGEQYSSSRQFHFKMTKRLKNQHQISFNYQFDKVNVYFSTNAADANIMTINYTF